MTNGAAQNLDILYPERESPEIVDVPPLSPKILLDDVFEENEESAEIMETDAGITIYSYLIALLQLKVIKLQVMGNIF